MSKRTLPLWGALLALVLALAACQTATPEAITTAPEPTAQQATAAPTQEVAPLPSPTGDAGAEAQPTPTPAATPVPGATSAPRPTPEWQIPMVQEDDWVSGPEDAGMTVVEYSDFQ